MVRLSEDYYPYNNPAQTVKIGVNFSTATRRIDEWKMVSCP